MCEVYGMRIYLSEAANKKKELKIRAHASLNLKKWDLNH